MIRTTYLKFREFIRAQFLPGEDQPDHVLRQQRERSQIQHLVAVLVDKLQHLRANETDRLSRFDDPTFVQLARGGAGISRTYLLYQGFRALVLDVTFRRRQQRAHRVDGYAALNETVAGPSELVQAVIVGRVHYTCNDTLAIGSMIRFPCARARKREREASETKTAFYFDRTLQVQADSWIADNK